MIKIQVIKQELVISSGYALQRRRNGDFSSSLNSALIELRNQAESQGNERLHSLYFKKKKFIYCRECIFLLLFFFQILDKNISKRRGKKKEERKEREKRVPSQTAHYCMTERDKSPTRFLFSLLRMEGEIKAPHERIYAHYRLLLIVNNKEKSMREQMRANAGDVFSNSSLCLI